MKFLEKAQVTRDTVPFDTIPHIAVAGRSNVGKSTLLNTLLGGKLAKMSKTPGRTRAIFCYRVVDPDTGLEFALADLPGFGYAKVSRDLRDLWQQWTAAYFGERAPLAGTVLCIDPRIGDQPVDAAFLEWLADLGHTRVILAGTKADRMNQSEKHHAKNQLFHVASTFPQLFVTPLMVSAKKNRGIHQLEEQIRLMIRSSEKETK